MRDECVRAGVCTTVEVCVPWVWVHGTCHGRITMAMGVWREP